LLKRAMSNQLPLMPAIKKLMDEVLAGPSFTDPLEGVLANERTIVANAKKIALFVAGAASQKYMQSIADQQEVMAAIADIVAETYMMESAMLRAMKMAENNGERAASVSVAMTQVYCAEAIERIESRARKVIAAVAEGDMLRMQLAVLKRLNKYEPVNQIALREQIAARTIEAGKYTIQ
jgi:alkylation response protein AidB-like acyl-CoA dehydrogenase